LDIRTLEVYRAFKTKRVSDHWQVVMKLESRK